MSGCSSLANINAESELKAEFLRLLGEALNLADRAHFSPEIGARLQEVLDLADELLGAGSPTRPE